MAAPTTDEVRQHVETDLSDEALQRLIDDVYSDITDRYGDDASQVDWLDGRDQEGLWLTRKASSITEVVEIEGTTETTLAADDYRQEGDFLLKRRSDGTNAASRWSSRVKVTYVPEPDARRQVVAIDLVKHELARTGKSSEKAGDYSATANPERDRRKILRRLDSKRRMVA